MNWAMLIWIAIHPFFLKHLRRITNKQTNPNEILEIWHTMPNGRQHKQAHNTYPLTISTASQHGRNAPSGYLTPSHGRQALATLAEEMILPVVDAFSGWNPPDTRPDIESNNTDQALQETSNFHMPLPQNGSRYSNHKNRYFVLPAQQSLSLDICLIPPPKNITKPHQNTTKSTWQMLLVGRALEIKNNGDAVAARNSEKTTCIVPSHFRKTTQIYRIADAMLHHLLTS